jgi:hypothetical protein
MANYTVVLNFNDGVHNYNLPLVYSLSDPIEGMKATVINGTRSNGAIVIPGGKRSQTISVRGRLFDNDGYKDIAGLIATMKTNITTDVATLTLKHLEGATWVNEWSYTVRRIEEISFPESLRTDVQEYQISFLVISY